VQKKKNYELVGCSAVEKLCSDDLNKVKVEENIFPRKVFPIPIGIDLHTFAGKGYRTGTGTGTVTYVLYHLY
jgi:hypothetical protein